MFVDQNSHVRSLISVYEICINANLLKKVGLADVYKLLVFPSLRYVINHVKTMETRLLRVYMLWKYHYFTFGYHLGL